MPRPELIPADLEEVDRLLHLADSCRVEHVTSLVNYSEIKNNAIHRAAEILGVGPEEKDDEQD